MSLAQCQDGDVRLVGSDLAGQVEVCISQRWGGVCITDCAEDTIYSVVCRQLGFSTGKSVWCQK